MTEKFPILKEEEVALSCAEKNTGIVLDESFKYATEDKQKVYTVFNNINEAIKFAKKIFLEKKSIEVYIHGQNEKLLYMLDKLDTNS